jgi:hypothetical protein
VSRPDRTVPAAPQSGEPGSWEAVLAAVEADLDRTEQLLAPSPAPATAALTPAEVMLPVGDEPFLPPLDRMPPVPRELAGRITELSNRIAVLSAELERCLAAARRIDRTPPHAVLAAAIERQPQFIDRRA